MTSGLAARLDVVVSRKIGAPNNPELAIGAVMPDGSYLLNKEIVDMLKRITRLYRHTSKCSDKRNRQAIIELTEGVRNMIMHIEIK